MEPQSTMILTSNAILPIKIGGRKYATTRHYVLSSLLKDETQQDLLLSHPTDKIQNVFNLQDQENYIKVVYEACNKFNEKKCRSIQHENGGNKTIGSLARGLIKDNEDFLYKTKTGPFQSIIGLNDIENMLYGYNIMGHSLKRMKHVVEKLPELSGVMEYIFWRSHPEQENIPKLTTPKTYRVIKTHKKPSPSPSTTPHDANDEHTDFFYEAEETSYDDNDETEEEGYNPEEVPHDVPVYSNDRIRWIATNMNSRLDDLRDLGARADFLYSMDAPLTDPFQVPTDLYSRTDPLYIFKIYKATEKLVEFMKSGMDIKMFLNKSVDVILWECKVSPELFNGGPLDPKQRHMIYVDYWRKFMSKTIPYYSFIEKEILYPQNLAGFIRKEYATELNQWIGTKISEILFASFIYQVIERSYPRVAPDLRIIVMTREMKKFTENEYMEITNKLYHLFFQGKFLVDEEGAQRIMTHESQRLTTDEINQALHFVPIKIISTPALDINNTILDPMHMVSITIDNKVFHDLFQYIFYKLFLFYTSCSQNEAYDHLFHNGEMMDGKDPKLQKKLEQLVRNKRMDYTRQALLAKYKQHPQIQEILLYAKASKNPIRSAPDDETMDLWNEIVLDPLDLELMRWVVSVVPSGNHHFEKSIHLYAFIHDMVRSLTIMKSIMGRRLNHKSIDVFIRCFYSKLKTIKKGVKAPKQEAPKEFLNYIKNTNTIQDENIKDLWCEVRPFIYLFQQKKFNPSELYKEAKNTFSSVNKKDLINALSNVVNCLYPEQEVSNDHFYMITQIISGDDNIPMWPDPSFELIRETSEEDHRGGDLPEEIRKRLPKRKSNKKKMETVYYNIIHPSFDPLQKDIQKAFNRPTTYDPIVSRASYALHTLQQKTIQPRRIVFYL